MAIHVPTRSIGNQCAEIIVAGGEFTQPQGRICNRSRTYRRIRQDGLCQCGRSPYTVTLGIVESAHRGALRRRLMRGQSARGRRKAGERVGSGVGIPVSRHKNTIMMVSGVSRTHRTTRIPAETRVVQTFPNVDARNPMAGQRLPDMANPGREVTLAEPDSAGAAGSPATGLTATLDS